MPQAGPQISLKTSRVVDAMAPIFNMTQRGEVERIIGLFHQQLASPLDISHLGGRTPLHSAVTRADTRLIKFYLSAGAEKDAPDSTSRTPESLAWDVILSNSKPRHVLDELQNLFPDTTCIEAYRFSRLHRVVLGLYHSTVEEVVEMDAQLLDRVDSQQNTTLFWAASRGNVNHVKRLLDLGADPSIRNTTGRDALMISVITGRYECMVELLKSGALIVGDDGNKTALHHACNSWNDLRYVEPIVRAGAAINELDYLQRSPLALAAFRDHDLIIPFLLENGADMEVKDAVGHTPLLRAIDYTALKAAHVFIENGADCSVIDKKGRNAIHVGIDTGDFNEIIDFFDVWHAQLATQIDPYLMDSSGRTPRDCLLQGQPSADVLKKFTALCQKIDKLAELHRREVEILQWGSDDALSDSSHYEDAVEY